MPLADRHLAADRIEFRESLTAAQIGALVRDPRLRVLQTAHPAPASTWERLDAELFARRPDVELRVYGHYGQVCDLGFVARLPHVRRFAADALLQATGVEHVRHLRNLEHLSIGIRSLDRFDFLDSIDGAQLTSLALGPTASAKPQLRPLVRFDRLERVCIDGHRAGIEVLGTLHRLTDLTLRSVTVPGLDFVRGLPNLRSVDIKLGGTARLAALGAMPHVRYLELWQIRGLEDLAFVESMEGLQFLFLQSLRRVTRLPDCSRLTSLRRVYLENLPGVSELAPIARGPALEEFIHVAANGRQPADYAPLLGSPTLRRMLVGFGSQRKNEALRQMQRAAGIAEYRHVPFEFR